ncbi:ABC transporter ATP-binding protein [Desulforhopalus sp. 52FAK]
MGNLKLDSIDIGYGKNTIIKTLTLDVQDGELLSLLGPSGVGKTSLLKSIAGLAAPINGSISIDGKDVTHRLAEKKDIVLLFQKPLLFPFLNVFDNISFGLKVQKLDSNQLELKTRAVMELTGIPALGHKMPSDLSGGQQQRVALARALVLEPSILLLDEPFSSLDADLRRKMQRLVRELQQETKTTMLFVTHDQSEAFSISDRIALMLGGKIVQVGSPEQLFSTPKTPEVAEFFGNPNVMSGRTKDNILFSDNIQIPVNHEDDAHCTAIIRPEDITLSEKKIQGAIPGNIIERHFEGPLTRLVVKLQTRTFTVLSPTSSLSQHPQVWLSLSKDKIHFFQDDRE